jgi:hypothetical protein
LFDLEHFHRRLLSTTGRGGSVTNSTFLAVTDPTFDNEQGLFHEDTGLLRRWTGRRGALSRRPCQRATKRLFRKANNMTIGCTHRPPFGPLSGWRNRRHAPAEWRMDNFADGFCKSARLSWRTDSAARDSATAD